VDVTTFANQSTPHVIRRHSLVATTAECVAATKPQSVVKLLSDWLDLDFFMLVSVV